VAERSLWQSARAVSLGHCLGAFALTTAILAYKTEVEATEVRVRYLPFYTKRTPMRNVTHLVEGKTLVLVTAHSKIPLWGLSVKAREPGLVPKTETNG